MTSDSAKLLASAGLFATWVTLVALKIQGSEDLIAAIKLMLTGFATHYLTYYDPTAKSPTIPQPPKEPK